MGFIPEVRRLLDSIGKFFDGFKGETLLVGLGIKNLQCGDFVFVVLNEFLKRLDDAFGAIQRSF